jgi:group I intron endonuclease
LLNREDHYIQTLCPEYNIAPLASNSSGWNHTEETKEKMQENYSDERRQRVAEINKGKTLSDETKALLREAALNRKPMSIETRLKCIVNVRPVTITELNGSNPQFFPTIVSAAQAIGCSVKTIQRALLFHFALQNEKAGYVSQSFARRVVLYGPTAHQNKLRDWIP